VFFPKSPRREGKQDRVVKCSQGERESRIGERKPGWFWDNLKIIFKRPNFFFFFFERQTIYGGK
jgi:hypothetical protein